MLNHLTPIDIVVVILIHPHPEITITYLYLILNLYYKLVLVPRTCTTSTYLYYVLHTLPVTNKAIPVAQGRERLYQAQHHLGNQCSSLLRSHSQ